MAWIVSGLFGCELVATTKHVETDRLQLPPITAPKDSIELEILFVDRPANDALMGDPLWKELDQLAGMPADARSRLRHNGWRIGHCSSHPPRGLAEMLDSVSEQPELIDRQRRMTGRKIQVLAGSEAPIEVTDSLPNLEFVLDQAAEPKTFENAKCVLRVKVEREQDGWVKLRFQPEIHHGDTVVRPVATALNWTRLRTPEIAPLYDQQFAMNLNVGEIAVISATQTDARTVGDAFFRSLEPTGQLQRMLVIRVSDMRSMLPTSRQPN